MLGSPNGTDYYHSEHLALVDLQNLVPSCPAGGTMMKQHGTWANSQVNLQML
jgi:hypothetical protein